MRGYILASLENGQKSLQNFVKIFYNFSRENVLRKAHLQGWRGKDENTTQNAGRNLKNAKYAEKHGFLFGGEGGNVYFCGEKNKEAMTLILDILSQILLTIGVTFAILVPFMWIPFVPAVARWMEKLEAQNEKEKEEKKKKKAMMKANAKKLDFSDTSGGAAGGAWWLLTYGG